MMPQASACGGGSVLEAPRRRTLRIGWIGVGRMGRFMAGHLMDAGHGVTLHDIQRDLAEPLLKRGALWATSPADAARGSKLVFLSLPTPEAAREVVLGEKGVIEGAARGAVVIETSTSSHDVVLELGQALRARGIRFMDSPVSGGERGAETRDLCVMASGVRATYDAVKPVLDLIGDKVMYCGPLGHGTVCKLCHQLFGSGMAQVAYEVLTTGVKAGVKLETLLEAISKSAIGKRPPLSGWREGGLSDSFEMRPYSVPLSIMVKDVTLARQLGRKFQVPMDVGDVVELRYVEAARRGWSDLDSGVTRRLQEERAGVRLRTSS